MPAASFPFIDCEEVRLFPNSKRSPDERSDIRGMVHPRISRRSCGLLAVTVMSATVSDHRPGGYEPEEKEVKKAKQGVCGLVRRTGRATG